MQCRNHKAFAERMLYYAARRYTEAAPAARGVLWALRPLVLVVITDFVLFEQLEGWRERFELRGQRSGVSSRRACPSCWYNCRASTKRRSRR